MKPSVLTALAVAIFAGVVGLLLVIFPNSRRELDYLAMGSVGVMISLLSLLVLAVKHAGAAPRRRAVSRESARVSPHFVSIGSWLTQ